MNSLTVNLGSRSYAISIGAGLLDLPETYQSLADKDVLLVSNETVAPLYLHRVEKAIECAQFNTVTLPDGEQFKTLETLNLIYDALLQHRYSRDCVIVALGGGVVGDIAGFAAASYQRGVQFMQIPTTLLSQVDSSVGGKTGVNHALGKNMIGAFHQPQAVAIDIQTLDTLPERELCAGLAEVFKYGLICDPGFFEWLRNNLNALLARDPKALSHAISRSCEIKAAIVSEDEREAGKRALLNLGHTFGHAFETGLGYGQWLHGEAVAAGMCLAADLSTRLGWMPGKQLNLIKSTLQAANLPTEQPKTLTSDEILALMKVDKKVSAGKLRLVLLHGIGEAVVTSDFDHSALLATLSGRVELSP